jgi:hypothetical protein
MRKIGVALVAAMTLTSLSACQSPDARSLVSRSASASGPVAAEMPAAEIQRAGRAPASSTWSRIDARSVCNGACAGKEGFSVLEDGHFVAGPDASGRTIEGQISDYEIAALDHAAAVVASQGSDESADFCTSTGAYLGTSIGIRMVLDDGSSFVAYDQRPEGTLCMRGERERVSEFESIFSHLMYKYYPEAF